MLTLSSLEPFALSNLLIATVLDKLGKLKDPKEAIDVFTNGMNEVAEEVLGRPRNTKQPWVTEKALCDRRHIQDLYASSECLLLIGDKLSDKCVTQLGASRGASRLSTIVSSTFF